MAGVSEAPASGAEAAPTHGAERVACLRVDHYNLEIREEGGDEPGRAGGHGFVGDRANSRAFVARLDERRAARRRDGADPLGTVPSRDRAALDRMLAEGGTGENPAALDLLREAIEDFARDFATVVRRFMDAPEWEGTERIVVGGGFRESAIGERAIARADAILKEAGLALDLAPIRNVPDEAGLIGAAHLCPDDLVHPHAGLLTVDIGGSNLRAGLVRAHRDGRFDLAACRVEAMEHWRHREDKPTRDEAVSRLVGMLRGLIDRAEMPVVPFVGIGCPGRVRPDGSIARGGQNLPGDWEADGFNLAHEVGARLPEIAGAPTRVVLHNDAVVQGLSEAPFMRDVARWGVLTIGTGLGNARFTNDAACSGPVPGP